MTSTDKITLFDLRCKKPEYGCWSPNVWKTRMILNYKKLPYQTTFLIHKELEPHLSALGISPNPPKPESQPGPPNSLYTVPAIQFPDGECIMESTNIAKALEAKYPNPPLPWENDLHNKVFPVLAVMAPPLMAILYPRIREEILMPESVDAWTEKKEKYTFKMPIDEYEATRGGEKAWADAEPGFVMLDKFLVEHKVDEGSFLMGSRVCYGDFILASMMESFWRINEPVYERAVERSPGLRVLHRACGEWLKEDW